MYYNFIEAVTELLHRQPIILFNNTAYSELSQTTITANISSYTAVH